MITIKVSNDEFNTRKSNVINRWSTYFAENCVEEDGGIYVDDRLIEFSFVEIKGARTVRDGRYVMVTVETEEESESESPKDTIHLIRFNDLVKPAINGPCNMTFFEYMKRFSVITFTREQFDKWISDGHIKISHKRTPAPIF